MSGPPIRIEEYQGATLEESQRKARADAQEALQRGWEVIRTEHRLTSLRVTYQQKGWSIRPRVRELDLDGVMKLIERTTADGSVIVERWGDRVVIAGMISETSLLVRTLRDGWERLVVGRLAGQPVLCTRPGCGNEAVRLMPLGVPICELDSTMELRSEAVPADAVEALAAGG